MTGTDRLRSDHLRSDVLIKAIDDELSASEAALLDSHLSCCEECRQKYQDLRLLSGNLESLVGQVPVGDSIGQRASQRQCLIEELDAREHANLTAHAPERVLRRFGWGMAIAAGLALGLVFAPRTNHAVNSTPPSVSQSAGSGVFEVAGETFVALPYSNPDLPLSTAHIVQMQVPVSSLTDAGIIFEPVSTEFSSPDRSVLADVLLGIDGQPLGVHVLGVE
jgi:hypothetical protein